MLLLEPAVLKMVGFGAVGLLAAGWLAVSFMKEGKGRTVLEWASAACVYVAFLALFLSGFRHARETGGVLLSILFAVLAALFASGGLVAIVRTLTSLARPGRDEVSPST